jgi:cytochrome c oxidase assembly protein subunit 11
MAERATISGAKNRRTALIAGWTALGMLGAAYASVPLYDLFCKTTGFGGTTQRASTTPARAEQQHDITIRFDSNTATALPWNFHPERQSLTFKIGDVALVNYVASSNAQTTTTGTAVFNVTPSAAGAYFNKISCFCFTKQTLKAGERVEMPVQFFVDPAILDDPDARNIKEITLSYTMYPADADTKTASVKSN